eukprot:2769243-Pleurochrysis_carterae.AAC.1
MVEDALASKPTRTIPPDVLSLYQSLVGALLYCSTQTRPDVAFAVGMLCRAMSCPTPELLKAAQRVLMYLSHHRSVGLRFEIAKGARGLLGLRLGDETLHLRLRFHVQSGGDIVVFEKTAICRTLVLRGGNHRGLRGEQRSCLPALALRRSRLRIRGADLTVDG